MRDDHGPSVGTRAVAALAAGVLLTAAAGCGSSPAPSAGRTTPRPPVVETCVAGSLHPLGSARRAYVGAATAGATAFRRPGGKVLARFGARNVNHYPTVFGVVGVVVGR